MTAALEGSEWSAAHPGRTLPPGKTRYPFYRRLGGPQGRPGRAENLVPTRILSQAVQPVVSRYTDWATRSTVDRDREKIRGIGWLKETWEPSLKGRYVITATYTLKMEASVFRSFGGVLPKKSRLSHTTAVFYLITATSSNILRDWNHLLNLLMPNVNYSGRTAPLTSKVALYIFIQQI